MKTRNLWLTFLLLAALATSTLPTSLSVGADGKGDVSGGGSNNTPPPCQDTTSDIVDKCADEPGNNECGGAVPWPTGWSGTSTGNVGPTDTDPGDWSQVYVYTTETLTPAASGGTDPIEVGTDCTGSFLAASSIYSSTDGPVYMHATPATGGKAAYTVGYSLTSNDAFTGKDVGNDYATSDPINAIPESTDPSEHDLYQGALPVRPDPVTGTPTKDQDWYRIHANLGPLTGVSSVGSVGTDGAALGLLTVYFKPNCDGGIYSLQLFQGDGTTPINQPVYGCGSPIMRSCIATGAAPVYAQLAIPPGSTAGTSYKFSADLSPAYVVNLDDGIHRTFLDPAQPWCDSLTPTILSLLGLFGEHLGVVNANGEVIASAYNP